MIRIKLMLVFLTCLGCAANPRATDPSTRLLFEDNFTDLHNWHLEGLTDGISIPRPGEMRIACEGSQQGSVGAMAFCRQEFPDNIAIEYDLVVENHNGLLITFVAMRGVNGEDAITGVPPRTGVFDDYVGANASTRSYHVSVCRYMDDGVHSGVSNWRRNPGLHLMTSGQDLCTQTGTTYHIRIEKKGPHCRLIVKGQPGPSFTDPQTLPGPIPTEGKIGFRAIGSKAVFRISNLRVLAL